MLRRVRDNPVVLAACVAGLRSLRAFGVMRSRRIYSHVPYKGTVRVDCGNGRSFFIESRGHNIENGLYWDGLFAHEPGSMQLWTTKAGSSGVVIDIGANSGVFALAATAMGAREVHAFEPLPRVHAILANNAELNTYPNLSAWPYAAGAEDGTATIFDPGGDAPTSASLSADFVSDHFGEIPGSDVRVVSIDTFCKENGIEIVDLIKIDVEGYEEHALRGMRKIVALSRPDILMEVLPGQEDSLRQVIEELWPGAYIWQRIEEGDGHTSRNVMLSSETVVSHGNGSGRNE